VCGAVLAVMGATEAYLKIGQNLSAAALTCSDLQKLKDKIDCELALDRDKRISAGVVFCRDVFSEYLKIQEMAAALLKNQRFVINEPGLEVVTVSSEGSQR
jgi:hypothetical protein